MKKVLSSHYGNDRADTLLRETRQEYEALIPALPYIGGRRNRLTKSLVGSVGCLALYRALKRAGKAVDETGTIIFETVRAQLGAYPTFLVRFIGRLKLSGYAVARLKKQAAESQRRRYPGNWVFTVLEGDGVEFSYGIDFSECGICKFFHSQEADELTPFLCVLDFPMSAAFGTGLVRTKTIAGGHEKCDFRFKRGRTVESGLPARSSKADDVSMQRSGIERRHSK